ncbi:MAG: hypothetical protein ACRYGI_00430 [Janthinobacterium lividum]
MFAEALNIQLLAALDRPDLRVVADRQRIVFDAQLDTGFRADPGGQVVLGAACLGSERICAFHIRHALELSLLLDAATRPAAADAVPSDIESFDLPILAGLCAARTASRFWLLDAAPANEPPMPDPASWLAVMAAGQMPGQDALSVVWGRVRNLQGSSYRLLRAARIGQDDTIVPASVMRALAACWNLLGPAETLMAQGGDARLAVDPHTGLNHYGCSHRPRPWAITFASSTASSLSERGFGGAEAARKRLAIAALLGQSQTALDHEAEQVRQSIADYYGLANPGPSRVVLAASGTDSELIALAICGLAGPDGRPARPVSNILLAPEETGAGVPLAAAGCHFADDTALGRHVVKGEPIDGFAGTTRVLKVAIRGEDGRLLPPDAVDAACIRMVVAEAGEGRTVLLHRLDLSKTGLLAPSEACLETLQARLGDQLEIVVDACQARLDRRRVQADLARGWMVMITGSKFFTGPPFCGALLLPTRLAARLHAPDLLPAGLADYGGRSDWPSGASAGAARALADRANPGMLLRWQAALAEMQAFALVPDVEARQRTASFIAGVESAIASSPDVLAVEVPAPSRVDLVLDDAGAAESGWDQLQTIRSFMVLEPGAGSGLPARRPLEVARARKIYRWLNADVSRVLEPDAGDTDRALARLLCHIGQPAPVAHDTLGPVMAGALRISVGARLLSGEPSHEGLDGTARMAREIADVRRIIDKIGLLLRHWDMLERLDPEPRFSSDAPLRRRADPGLNI